MSPEYEAFIARWNRGCRLVAGCNRPPVTMFNGLPVCHKHDPERLQGTMTAQQAQQAAERRERALAASMSTSTLRHELARRVKT